MIFGINTTNCHKFHSPNGSEIMYNNFEISLVVFMLNITTNHAITYTNLVLITVVTRNTCIIVRHGFMFQIADVLCWDELFKSCVLTGI